MRSDLEDISLGTYRTEKQRDKSMRKQNRISKNWDNYKRYNVHIMGILKGEEREQKQYWKQ